MTDDVTTREEELVEKTRAFEAITVEDVPQPIMDVLLYMDGSTGLLDDYNDAEVMLIEGGDTIQWYPRSNFFSAHDDLLTWLQTEADGVILGQVGKRPHPNKTDSEGEPVESAYIEIHETSRWVRE